MKNKQTNVLLEWYVDATKTVMLLFFFVVVVVVCFEIVYYGNLAQGWQYQATYATHNTQ